jgi:hypothetical protein
MTNVKWGRLPNAGDLKEHAHRDLFVIRHSSFVIHVIRVVAECCR